MSIKLLFARMASPAPYNDKLIYLFSLILLFVFISVTFVNAELYIWTDENGVKHFSNTAPLEALENMEDVKNEEEINSSGYSDNSVSSTSESGSALPGQKQKSRKFNRGSIHDKLSGCLASLMRNNLNGIYQPIKDGDAAKVRSMVSSDSSLALPDTKRMWSPLEFAIACGNVEITKFLIGKGNDVNRKNHLYGCTPLNMAVATANLKMVKLLITNGADVNANSGGFGDCSFIWGAFGTPLQASITTFGSVYSITYEQAASVFDFLIRHGADPNIKNCKGQLPYEFGVKTRKRDLLEQVYKKHGIPTPNVAYSFEELKYFVTQLVQEDKSRAIPAARKMIKVAPPALFKEKDQFGDTLLYYAIDDRIKDLTELMIIKGADVNAANERGETPMHEAIYEIETLKLLISRGANVNAQDKKGQTPLHLNAMSKYSKEEHLKIAGILLQHNAQPDIKDKAGKMAVDYARDNGLKEMVALLSGTQ